MDPERHLQRLPPEARARAAGLVPVIIMIIMIMIIIIIMIMIVVVVVVIILMLIIVIIIIMIIMIMIIIIIIIIITIITITMIIMIMITRCQCLRTLRASLASCAGFHRWNTISFRNFKSQQFKLSVSNPKSKYVAYLSVLSQISNCQSLGRKNKHEILKTDRRNPSNPTPNIS